MQRMDNRRMNILLPGALFSGMGIFAWILLANYTEADPKIEATLRSGWAWLFLVGLFNALGFLTVRISAWLNAQYVLNARQKWKIALVYAAVMVMYLLIDYGFLVTAKFLAGTARPFVFPNGGVRILIVVWFVELVVLGLLLANRAMAQMLRLRQQAAELQEESNIARYAALQAQLNPHFLFNSLNTLVAEIEYDPPRAVRFTRNLSEVYRYVLQAQSRPLVTLGEELQFAVAYLYLHEVRLGDCIKCLMEVPDDCLECRLPPFTLQLLVENVIKHNSITQNKPMQIHIGVDENCLTVANTLNPKKCDDSTGVGLKNLSNRCQIMFGRKIEIVTTNGLFTVKIPILHE